jgi:hypothetical protein
MDQNSHTRTHARTHALTFVLVKCGAVDRLYKQISHFQQGGCKNEYAAKLLTHFFGSIILQLNDFDLLVERVQETQY